MHLIYYRNREDINALVHTHSPYAKTIASLGWELPAVSYLIAFAGPNVRCAPYETFGTKQLAEAAFEGMIDRRAVLLANHGLIAGANHIKWHLPLQKKLSFVHKFIIKRKALGNRSYCQKTRWRIWRRSLKGMGSSRRKSSLLWR